MACKRASAAPLTAGWCMQSTTPLDPRALDKMLPYLTNTYGNPHSRTHLYGWESEDAVEAARAQIASLIGASQCP